MDRTREVDTSYTYHGSLVHEDDIFFFHLRYTYIVRYFVLLRFIVGALCK